MDRNDAPRARCDRFFQPMKINLPSVIVKQGIWRELYVLNVGEKIEQGIAWRRNQELVPWIAESSKHKRICFARAGGKNHVLDIDKRAVRGIVFGDSATRCFEAFRIGPVGRELPGWRALGE